VANILTRVSKYGASIPWSRLDKIAAILLFGADHGQIGSNANSGGGGIRENAARTTLAYSSGAGHSLRYDLSAPPPASQVFATGVASARQTML
jgi:hypothetical protein